LPAYVPNERQQFSFLMSEDFQERVNIAWRVEEAEKDPKNPLLEPKSIAYEPHDLDGAVAFLADESSRYVTPQTLLVWRHFYRRHALYRVPEIEIHKISTKRGHLD
jgi:NAD(P)-dependent dehydrogenase (short-subunit alcohol dehydrogenase family)